MPKKLTREDFWDDFCFLELYQRTNISGYACPKCGALIKDIDLHITFHRVFGDG